MPATLKVQVYHSTGRNLQGYTLKIKVTEAEEMSPAVFVFQRPKTKPDGTRGPDRFVCVADAVDMEEVPELGPDFLDEMPYYRTSEVELVFRNPLDRDCTENDIKGDITALVQSLDAMSNVALKEWRIVGDPYSGMSQYPDGFVRPYGSIADGDVMMSHGVGGKYITSAKSPTFDSIKLRDSVTGEVYTVSFANGSMRVEP